MLLLRLLLWFRQKKQNCKRLSPQKLPHAMWGGMKKRRWRTSLAPIFPLTHSGLPPFYLFVLSFFLSLTQSLSFNVAPVFNASLPSKVKTFASHVIKGWVKASTLLTLVPLKHPYFRTHTLSHTHTCTRNFFFSYSLAFPHTSFIYHNFLAIASTVSLTRHLAFTCAHTHPPTHSSSLRIFLELISWEMPSLQVWAR